jgi:hypothetical protein
LNGDEPIERVPDEYIESLDDEDAKSIATVFLNDF